MSSGSRKHLLAVTIPVFGHVIPLTGLLTKLLDSCPELDVTFVISASKKEEVLQRGGFASRHLPGRVTVIPLEDGLPRDIESQLSAHHLMMIKEAMDGPLVQLLENMPVSNGNQTGSPAAPGTTLITHPVDAVISDIYAGTCGEICKKRGIPWYSFVTSAAKLIAAMFLIPEDVPTVSDEAFFKPEFDSSGQLMMPESVLKFFMHCKRTCPLATEIVVNSSRELESEVAGILKFISKLKDIPVRFVGPILPENQKITTKSAEKEAIIKWLDSKDERSVVYVSFGSMVHPELRQLKEMAEALLLTKKPFIWSLRASLHEHLPEVMQAAIAEQLSSSVPFLVIPWAPQQDVLAHPAVKVFVSHCGWNGTLEALSSGIPFVAWPMFGDQYINAELLVKEGIAIKIPGTSLRSDRLVPPEELSTAILEVGGWNTGNGKDSYFQSAQRWGEKVKTAIATGGSADVDFQNFLTSQGLRK